jgi:hypothetical protein
MLDEKTHELPTVSDREFPDIVDAPRPFNAAAWLRELAALEAEFRTILKPDAFPVELVPQGHGKI